MRKSKHFLFHYLLEQFKAQGLKDQHFLVAVSGGVDSMTLLSVLLEIKKVLNLHISIVHVHHGAKNSKQKQFQDQALKTVTNFWDVFTTKNLSKKQLKNKNIYCIKPDVKAGGSLKVKIRTDKQKINKDLKIFKIQELKSKPSEADMRKYRYEIFSHCMKSSKADYLVLAHTADDLLETRLIRLIRGTGEQGLTAMSFKRNQLIRPFIHVSRFQIMDYAKKTKLKWLEDPSNQSAEYSFRNWIRREWLPLLEKKRPGSVTALSRSLDLVANKAQESQRKIKALCQGLIKNRALRRDIILFFSSIDRKKILAYYIKQQGFKNYRAGHILEMLKHIKRPQNKFRFSLLGRTWKMDAKWLVLEPEK